MMEYDLKAMDLEIRTIEEGTKRLKELGRGFEAVERNADAILAFTYILRRNISDIIE
jgi:predicted RNA-binding protein with PUA domain